MAEPFTATFSGNGRYPRAIRELQQIVGRTRTGQTDGTLVNHTSRGTLIRPNSAGTGVTTPLTPASPTPRWG